MSPARLSRMESALRIILEYKDAFNRHDVPGMMKLVGENCILETAAPVPDGTVFSGRQNITHYWEDFFHRSPQARMEVEEATGLGNRCVLRWKCRHVDAQGKETHVRGVDIYQVAENLIHHQYSYAKAQVFPY